VISRLVTARSAADERFCGPDDFDPVVAISARKYSVRTAVDIPLQGTPNAPAATAALRFRRLASRLFAIIGRITFGR
jgi:hypothetical protein